MENNEFNLKDNVTENVKSTTPMMQQYLSIKKEYPDCLLLTRMGDFYELFFDDAKIVSKAIGLTLTKRGTYNGSPIPMCGVPYHSFDLYAKKLLHENFKLAICEQLENPEEAKKRGSKSVVQRDVVRVITAGTIFEEEFLEGMHHNFLMAFCSDKKQENIGIALTDISTGDFLTLGGKISDLQSIIDRYSPSEIITSNSLKYTESVYPILKDLNVQWLPDAKFDLFSEKSRLMNTFDVKTLDSFGNFNDTEIIAAGAIIGYIELTQKNNITLSVPKKLKEDNFLYIDSQTIRNLNLIDVKNGDKKNSLLATIKNTKTAFGGRLLNMRMIFPQKDIKEIDSRLNAVQFFIDNQELMKRIIEELSEIPDFERAISRIKFKRAVPSDFGMVISGLKKAIAIKELLMHANVSFENEVYSNLCKIDDFNRLIETLQNAFNDTDLPNNLRSNGFIKTGYSKELDEYRNLVNHSAEMISNLEAHYIRETGINTLKIKSNNIIGFFVEIPNSQREKLSEEFIKKQDTVNSGRYKTIEISELEQKMIIANERLKELEFAIFYEMIDYMNGYYDAIKNAINVLAIIDVASGNAEFAIQNNLTRPIIDDSLDIEIKSGRHIVIEKRIGNEKFIPNDTYITKSKISIVTGPNMAGKSTYLRQNALIILMAHIGLYVPAMYARIGVVDKVFSRIGASDDIASGKSTFMVEMIETATILNQATERSFVILDEVGRGTSTYDGFAIAAGVVDHLYHVNKSRTFFATHYHEIQYLSLSMPLLKFLTLRISEHGDDVIFHHQIVNGVADKSYGLYVAKIAGIPARVLKYSKNLLNKLQDNNVIKNINVQKLDLK